MFMHIFFVTSLLCMWAQKVRNWEEWGESCRFGGRVHYTFTKRFFKGLNYSKRFCNKLKIRLLKYAEGLMALLPFDIYTSLYLIRLYVIYKAAICLAMCGVDDMF